VFFVVLLPANINAAIKYVDYQKGMFEGKGLSYLFFFSSISYMNLLANPTLLSEKLQAYWEDFYEKLVRLDQEING
jgi:hypothetical protein